MLMVVVSIALFIIYVLIILFLITRWERLKTDLSEENDEQIFFSLIISARNEENNIGKLLTSLDKQQYSRDRFEVLIIDDDSYDSTVDVVRQLRDKLSTHVTLMTQKSPLPGMTPKKSALTQGIGRARGEWIITMDADCFMQENWLNSANRYISNKNIVLCLGPVLAEGENQGLVQQFQVLELAALTGITAITADARLPVLANGANMAFKKDVFYNVDGYKGNANIPTGDDIFLLEKVNQKYPGRIGYNRNADFLVTTKETTGLSAFINQRIRWAGKWRRYNNKYTTMLAFLSFVFNLNVIILVVLAIFTVLPWYILIILLVVKAVFEGWYLRGILKKFAKDFNPVSFLLLQIIYPIYLVIIGLLSHFVSYTWKGRNWKS